MSYNGRRLSHSGSSSGGCSAGGRVARLLFFPLLFPYLELVLHLHMKMSLAYLPIWLLFAILWLILPVSEGVLQYAVAPLFGVPLIMLFNMLGYNPVVSLSCWAVMWPLGDCLPPTAVVGRAAVLELDYKGDYYKGFVKSAIVPMLVILALCTVMMIFNKSVGNFLGV